MAVLLAAADTYVVVVALPSIMNGVGVGLDRLQRATPIISGFLLGYTAVLPLIGRLADLAGTDPVFAGCLAAFGAGSVVTATAHALPVVVAGRALQGLGGGGLVPVTLAMVAARWPPDARGLPLGIVGALQELGSVIGPLYGAAIVAVASWRAIFWINVPVTLVLGAGFWLDPPAHVTRRIRAAERGHATAVRRRSPAPVLAMRRARPGCSWASTRPPSLATSASFGRAWSPVGRRGLGAVHHAHRAGRRPAAGRRSAAGWRWPGPASGYWRALRPGPHRAGPGRPARRAAASPPSSAAWWCCSRPPTRAGRWWRRAPPGSAPLAVAADGGVLVASAPGGGAADRARRLRGPPGLGRPGRQPGGRGRPDGGPGGRAALRPVHRRPQLGGGAALVLRALPGGRPGRRRRRGASVPAAAGAAPVVAAAGMALAAGAFVAMTSWSATALGGGPRWSDVELVVCGLGFGLAIAPGQRRHPGRGASRRSHALASALAVVARTIGMLAGLSALTAIALHRFYEAQARIGSPFALCPEAPGVVPGLRQRHHQGAAHASCTPSSPGPRSARPSPACWRWCCSAAGPVSADAGDTTTSSALPRLLG